MTVDEREVARAVVRELDWRVRTARPPRFPASPQVDGGHTHG
jgi:hypothetical protein